MGVLRAADEARQEGVQKILAIEFGVAAGNGLVALQEVAEAVERETQVAIEVVGFDSGAGMPEVPFNHKDHTDWWIPRDYPMDVQGLTKRLTPRTKLILGPVADTVHTFLDEKGIPIGFVSFDLDYYTSTKCALRVLSGPKRRMLRRTLLYFDDTDYFFCHRFAGELLAIEEFNAANDDVKIDRWQDVRRNRPFPDADYLGRMYIAHDLAAIDSCRPDRPIREHAR